MSREDEQEEHLSGEEVRRRAVSGAAIDVVRGFGIRFLSLFGVAVLARELTPEDFGVVAVGATLLTFGTFLSDGGIAAALIRQPEPPSREDLKAFHGLQLILTLILGIAIALVAAPFGLVGEVTALMVLSLPLTAVRVPSGILLERRLDYRTPAAVDLVETITYYVWAVIAVSLGYGVWSLASAVVVRTLVGTIFLLAIFPAGRIPPSPSWARVRPLLGFGFRYQANAIVVLLRDQGINLCVAVAGGVSTLGLYTVAYRVVQVPLLLFSSLWRVSFPGMSRLVHADENMRPTIERVLALSAVAAGLMLAPLAASAQDLIPVLLGDRWSDAAAVVPTMCLNIMIAGPVSVALFGYLWAVGEAGAVLRSTWLGIPFLFAVLLALLPVIGVSAVGFGWIAAGVVEIIVLVRAARKHVEFTFASRLVPPSLFATIAAALGWLGSRPIHSDLVGGIAAAGIASGVYLLSLWFWHRSYLRDAIALGSKGLRGALGTSGAR